jgi:transposase
VDPRDQRIAELEALTVQQAAIIEQQQAMIEALTKKVEELERTVADLTERLNRNSRNSHLPPSSDGPGQRGGGQKKGKGKKGRRKRGGQPGHGGHHRKLLPPEEVDEIVDHYPTECDDCGAGLPQVEDAEAVRTQRTEIPPVKPVVTEDRYHAVTCNCGCTTRAKSNAPTSTFGPRLMGLIALFTGVYHLSRRQAVAVLRDVLGVKISLGALSSIEKRVSDAIESPVAEAWAKVHEAAVRHADATAWLEGGDRRSLWTIATETATVFKIVIDGSAETIKPLFAACQGLLISDRAKAFLFWPMKRRQICWAHLMRKFISFSERDGPAKRFGDELSAYTELIFKYWRSLQDGKIDRKTFRDWMAPVRERVEDCLGRAVAARIEKVSGSCADILAHQEALWTYVDRLGVEPTNNHAERELRAFVLWRKRCFGSQSERGNLFAERIMTVAHTARKQEVNPLEFLTACCEAQHNRAAAPSLFTPALAAA